MATQPLVPHMCKHIYLLIYPYLCYEKLSVMVIFFYQ